MLAYGYLEFIVMRGRGGGFLDFVGVDFISRFFTVGF